MPGVIVTPRDKDPIWDVFLPSMMENIATRSKINTQKELLDYQEDITQRRGIASGEFTATKPKAKDGVEVAPAFKANGVPYYHAPTTFGTQEIDVGGGQKRRLLTTSKGGRLVGGQLIPREKEKGLTFEQRKELKETSPDSTLTFEQQIKLAQVKKDPQAKYGGTLTDQGYVTLDKTTGATIIDPKIKKTPKTSITDQEIDAIAEGMVNNPQYTQGEARKLRALRLENKKAIARVQAKGKVEGVISSEDAKKKASLVIRGLETFDYFKNVFGVSVQEQIRSAILDIDPDYNFLERRVSVGGLTKSYNAQEKQRGMMGSFVTNINKQLDRVEEMAKDLGRIDVRILDMPVREAKTRLLGSGKEKAYEAYLLEISNEIAKLSTGSSASIRELSTEAQERWDKIHDKNLSMNQMKIILNETRLMASMRLASTDEQLERTIGELKTRGVRQPGIGKKDGFGFSLGETKNGYKYIGNNKWQK